MLKDILEEQNLTVYALAKQSGIPYTTLKDLVTGKTSMDHVSASVLYKLSVCLKISMEDLYLGTGREKIFYLYNKGRDVYLAWNDLVIQYMGPKNLVSFRYINRFEDGCLSVECWFEEDDGSIYSEEDYIDLEDLLEENGYEKALLDYATVKIGLPNRSLREELIDEALLVSDYMAILHNPNSTEEIELLIINIARPGSKMILRLRDYAILSTNMGKAMQKRAIDSVKRNQTLIRTEVEERIRYA